MIDFDGGIMKKILIMVCVSIVLMSCQNKQSDNSTVPIAEDCVKSSLQTVSDSHSNEESKFTQQQTNIVGGWQRGGVEVGAGRDAVYLFLPDGSYHYVANTMERADRLRYHSGTWNLEEDVLVITTTKKKIVEGGIEVKGDASTLSDIENGELVTYYLDSPETIRIPIHTKNNDMDKMTILNFQYYKINLPPYYLEEIEDKYTSDDMIPY